MQKKFTDDFFNFFIHKSIKLAFNVVILTFKLLLVISLLVTFSAILEDHFNTIANNYIISYLINEIRLSNDNFTQLIQIRSKVMSNIKMESMIYNLDIINRYTNQDNLNAPVQSDNYKKSMTFFNKYVQTQYSNANFQVVSDSSRSFYETEGFLRDSILSNTSFPLTKDLGDDMSSTIYTYSLNSDSKTQKAMFLKTLKTKGFTYKFRFELLDFFNLLSASRSNVRPI